MKIISYIVIFILMGTAVLQAYVRLAPSDPALWHVAVASADAVTPGPCADKVTLVAKGARATCSIAGNPADLLTKLDAVALATPRTTRLAGSVEEGRITWVSRSLLMGYPDYITAEASPSPAGARLDIFARQRFGESDFGVNAARLKDWLSRL